MTRVKVIVEGQTEESFVKNVLAPFLWPRGVYLTPLILGVPGHQGGNVNYARLRKDILLQLKQDRTAHCSTMLDLYGLGTGFPGTPAPQHLNGSQKAEHIESEIHRDISAAAPDLLRERHFMPYLQVYEYEGLLFSDPETFGDSLGRGDISTRLRGVRDAFATPEDINDNPNSAPSKRVLTIYPGYKKVIEGTTAALRVGIDNIVRECPHFRSWVERLAAWSAP